MEQIIGFTRKETICLTGCTSNRIANIERARFVIPYRYGTTGGKPTVIFSWEQLLGIRLIRTLRKEDISVEVVKQIINFLTIAKVDKSLHNKQLIALGDELFWVEQDWSDFGNNIPQALKTTTKETRHYTLLVIPPLKAIINEIWVAAQTSRFVDFQSFRRRARSIE